jgi:hypothetical protein
VCRRVCGPDAPPCEDRPVVVCYDGKDYLLKDGFHRVEAAVILGRKTILAEIIPGTRAEMHAEWRRYLAELKASLAQ